MKKVSVIDAVGMSICHDITAMYDGFKGPVFKRGHIVTKEDINILLKIGKKCIYVWEDIENEIHEEDAARRMADALECEYVHFEGPSEGKINMIADEDGMFIVDKDSLKKLNSIEDVTVTVVPNHFPVKKGDKLASMRIVPLTTKIQNIEMFENLCKEKRILSLCKYNFLKVSVIITGSEVYEGIIEDRFEKVARNKLKKYPAQIVSVSICDDDKMMIVNAIKSAISLGAELIIISGGMSVDPDDVTKVAIRECDSEVVTYGIPAQPGNMTMVAYINDITILGIPGAAISMPTTTFDVMLPQVFSRIKFSKDELLNMAEGGLCYNCQECHFPKCTFGRY